MKNEINFFFFLQILDLNMSVCVCELQRKIFYNISGCDNYVVILIGNVILKSK